MKRETFLGLLLGFVILCTVTVLAIRVYAECRTEEHSRLYCAALISS